MQLDLFPWSWDWIKTVPALRGRTETKWGKKIRRRTHLIYVEWRKEWDTQEEWSGEMRHHFNTGVKKSDGWKMKFYGQN